MNFNQAVFLQIPIKTDLTIKSYKDKSLKIDNLNRPIVRSIVDKQGNLVKLAHRWFREMSKSIGIAVSEGTLEQYGRSLTYFVRWIEFQKPFSNLSIDECFVVLRRNEIKEWIISMRHSGISSSTIYSRETAIKQFLDWLTTHDGGNLRKRKDSPWGDDDQVGMISKKPNKKSPKVISSEHIVELLSNLHNECERCMFHMQYDVGLRISELVNFKQKDLPNLHLYPSNIEFIPITVTGVKGRAGNTKQRISIISKAVLSRIQRYHSSMTYRFSPDWDINDPEKPVFLTANGLIWSNRNASKQFRQAVNRSNLPHNFVTHWMRHGTAFSILQSDFGKDLYDRMLVVQQMLGHEDLTTTEIYTQIAPSLLINISSNTDVIDRSKQAEYIRDLTFLPPLKHIETRGHF